MNLNELFKISTTTAGTVIEPPWEMALKADFGGVQAWRDQFSAMAKARRDDARWAILAFRPREGTLVNELASRDAADDVPLLAFDLQQGGDVDEFLRTVDHAGAYARYQVAVDAASEGLGCGSDIASASRLLDVRRDGAFAKATHIIEGAQWRDPSKVGDWAAQLPAASDVVVYCVYGHEVGRVTALRLRAAGIKARFLEGGIDEWQKRGGPLQPK